MKIRTSLKTLMILAGVLFLLFNPASSKADMLYYITSDHATGGLGTAPFGSVNLVQNGTTVDVTVHLYSGYL